MKKSTYPLPFEFGLYNYVYTTPFKKTSLISPFSLLKNHLSKFVQKSKLHKISENSPRSSMVFLSPVRFKRTLPCRRSCYHEDPPKKYWSHPEDLLDHSARPITMDPDDPHGPHGFQQRTERKQVMGNSPTKMGLW